MIRDYNDFLVLETIKEFLPLNENITIPSKIEDLSKKIADSVAQKKGEVIDDIKLKYKDKSLKEIISESYKTIKESGVGEFAGEVGVGVLKNLRPIAKFFAKKTGEYGTIALLAVSVIDWLIPFGIADSWFTVIEWKLGLAIIISLVIYILARKKN